MKKFLFCIILLPLVFFAQTENWVYQSDYSGDVAFAVVYGTDDTIYAAGKRWNTFAIISLTTDGDSNWMWIGPASCAFSLVYGADGNIYAAGFKYVNGTEQDLVVVSMTPAGNVNWIYEYNGPNDDAAYSIIYGDDGNIYTAGHSYDDDNNSNFIVISLSTAGDTNWTYRMNGHGCANSLVFGADGNIYAAGYSTGDGSYPNYTVISLTNTGHTNWVYRYKPWNWGCAFSVAYGADGNIYTAGRSQRTQDYNDFTVISLTPAGDTNWVFLYNVPGTIVDEAVSIVYGADGNVYAAGSGFTVVSLMTTGKTNWICQYNTGKAYSVTYGTDSNIYVSGYSIHNDTSDFTVASFTTTGDTNWTYHFNGTMSSTDIAFSLVYGADGNIYAAGYTCTAGRLFTVVSLSPDVGVMDDNTVVKNGHYSTSIFSGSLHLPEGKNCKIFDITGRVVMPDRMRPGVYFIEIDGEITQKIIKLR